MNITDIIAKKRDGGALSGDEIRYFITGYTSGSIPDYQASALIMAIYLRGMDRRETFDLTMAMAYSGKTLDLSCINGVTADKHSTGGIGDKTTLVTVPIAACCGVKVAKLSGRGLGFTGGTVDKLESIPGFRTSVRGEEFLEICNKTGACIAAQTADLAPADKLIYALRDSISAVDSLPLIASSIMSKKIASGAGTIVLDVKYGSGAFMKTPQEAEKLAQMMIDIGKAAGRRVSALITNMNIPLGRFIGNSLEVYEAVGILKNGEDSPLTTLCLELAAAMISSALGEDIKQSRIRANNALYSGEAVDRLCRMVSAQGGDVSVIENRELLKKASYVAPVVSDKSGYVCAFDSALAGASSGLLGAGRAGKDDEIDHTAGIEIVRGFGDYVGVGDEIARLYTSSLSLVSAAEEMYRSCVTLSENKPSAQVLIYKVL